MCDGEDVVMMTMTTKNKTARNVLLRTFVDDDDQSFPFFLSFFIIVAARSVVDAL
jgi:hypothetical protein